MGEPGTRQLLGSWCSFALSRWRKLPKLALPGGQAFFPSIGVNPVPFMMRWRVLQLPIASCIAKRQNRRQ
ncbi:hypothetical protein CBM2598_U20068 [Cupriavidus taiwanensis]|nr:hypothetical protein CBM2598_U20068 [Cupriavidus taiwanensis]